MKQDIDVLESGKGKNSLEENSFDTLKHFEGSKPDVAIPQQNMMMKVLLKNTSNDKSRMNHQAMMNT